MWSMPRSRSILFSDKADTLKTVIDRARDGMKGCRDRRRRRLEMPPPGAGRRCAGLGFARPARSTPSARPQAFPNMAEKPRAQAMLLFGPLARALPHGDLDRGELQRQRPAARGPGDAAGPSGRLSWVARGVCAGTRDRLPALVSLPGTIANLVSAATRRRSGKPAPSCSHPRSNRTSPSSMASPASSSAAATSAPESYALDLGAGGW